MPISCHMDRGEEDMESADFQAICIDIENESALFNRVLFKEE